MDKNCYCFCIQTLAYLYIHNVCTHLFLFLGQHSIPVSRCSIDKIGYYWYSGLTDEKTDIMKVNDTLQFKNLKSNMKYIDNLKPWFWILLYLLNTALQTNLQFIAVSIN